MWNEVILVAIGPSQGSPEGLYMEAADEDTLTKEVVVRNFDGVNPRFTADPTFSIYVVNPRLSTIPLSSFGTLFP
jgi:hypothetical protein